MDDYAIAIDVNYVASFLTPHVGLSFEIFCIRTFDLSIRDRYSITSQPVRWTKYSSISPHILTNLQSLRFATWNFTKQVREARSATINSKYNSSTLWFFGSFNQNEACSLELNLKKLHLPTALPMGCYLKNEPGMVSHAFPNSGLWAFTCLLESEFCYLICLGKI